MKSKAFTKLLMVSALCLAGYSAEAAQLKGKFENILQEVVYTLYVQPTDTMYQPLTYTGYGKELNVELKGIRGEVDIRLSVPGYSEVTRRFTLTDEKQVVDLGTIPLERVVELEEVVVRANKMQLKREGANYTISHIQQTPIGQAGNFFDMLRLTPGVMVQNTDIEVLGKGKPEIYINGRKVKNKEELYAHQSTNVRSIEIIRQPDAQYDASTPCVIRITLRENVRDYMGLNASNATDIKEKVSNTTSLNYNINKGIVSGMASLSYMRGNEKLKDYARSVITHNDGSLFETDASNTTRNKSNMYTIFAGLNFDFRQKGRLGIQYTGGFVDLASQGNGQQTITRNSTEDKELTSDKDMNMHLHSVSLSYLHTATNGNAFSIVADYASKGTKIGQDIQENNLTTGEPLHTAIDNRINYDIYTLTPEYKFKFGKKDNEAIGLNVGYIHNEGDNYINRSPQLTNRKDYYFAPYYTYSQSWNKWSVNLGLRYEYDKIDTRMGGENELQMHRTCSNLFPNARVSYKATDKIDLSLYYRKTVARPSFSDLDPTISYIDEYNYSTGNPNLEPSFKDNIELHANLYGLGLNVRYAHIKNDIQWVAMTEDGNSDVSFLQPVNLQRSHEWVFTADYSWSKKWFRMYLAGTLRLPYAKYTYLDETLVNDQLSCRLNARLTFNIYKSLSLYVNGSYASKEHRGITRYEPTNCIDAGVSAFFFKNKLYVAIDGSDFLRRSVTPEWERSYLNVYKWQRNRYDTRGVRITLRWLFNSIRSNFIPKSGNMEQLSRTM